MEPKNHRRQPIPEARQLEPIWPPAPTTATAIMQQQEELKWEIMKRTGVTRAMLESNQQMLEDNQRILHGEILTPGTLTLEETVQQMSQDLSQRVQNQMDQAMLKAMLGVTRAYPQPPSLPLAEVLEKK
ncbi:hypothetical protein ASF91_15125 [Rhizobium sp. Leaf155]|nr:hypothetical protein ASF91_15125 [Rhizobium sp. Leaf155]